MSVEQSNQKKLLPPMCAEQSEQEVVHLEVKTSVPPKELAGRTGAERYECGGGDFTFGEQYTLRVAGVLRVKKVSIKAVTSSASGRWQLSWTFLPVLKTSRMSML